MRRYPLSFIVPTALGVLATIASVMAFAGVGDRLHPLLNDTGAGIALAVSAIALFGSGLFPFVIARLMRDADR